MDKLFKMYGVKEIHPFLERHCPKIVYAAYLRRATELAMQHKGTQEKVDTLMRMQAWQLEGKPGYLLLMVFTAPKLTLEAALGYLQYRFFFTVNDLRGIIDVTELPTATAKRR